MATVNIRRKVASNPNKPAARNGRSTKNVAAKKAASKNPSNKSKANSSGKSKKNKKKAASRNPSTKKNFTHKSSKNPSFFANPKDTAIGIVTALLAAVATRQIPQWLLGANNASWTGYAVNAGTALAAAFGANEFISPTAGLAALTGGGVIILDRVLTEKLSPVGQYLALAGLGDATAATSLGTISEGYYIHPTIFRADGTPLIPHQITDAAVAAFNNMQPRSLPAGNGAPSGSAPRSTAMQGASRYNRFGSRF